MIVALMLAAGRQTRDAGRRMHDTRRVGGSAADMVKVGIEIIRHDIGTVNHHRVGGEAANPTDIPRDIAATTLKNQPTLFAADG